MTSDVGADAGLPERIRLRVGETRELVLPGLGTAGYRWGSTVEGDPRTVTATWHRGWPPGEPARPAGLSAPERLTLTGAAPGRVVVRLAQSRPWERGAPRAAYAIAVEVA